MKQFLRLICLSFLTSLIFLPATGQDAQASTNAGIMRLTQEYINIAEILDKISSDSSTQNNPSTLRTYLENIARAYDTLLDTQSVTPYITEDGKRKLDSASIECINAEALQQICQNKKYAPYAGILDKLRRTSLQVRPLQAKFIANTISPELAEKLPAKKRTTAADNESEDDVETTTTTNAATYVAILVIFLILFIAAGLILHHRKSKHDDIKKTQTAKLKRAQATIDEALNEINKLYAIIEKAYQHASQNEETIAEAKEQVRLLSMRIENAAEITGSMPEIPEMPAPPEQPVNTYGIVNFVCSTDLGPELLPLKEPQTLMPGEEQSPAKTYSMVVHNGNNPPQHYLLNKPVISVGRIPRNAQGGPDVGIDTQDKAISRVNAILSYKSFPHIPGCPAFWVLAINQKSEYNPGDENINTATCKGTPIIGCIMTPGEKVHLSDSISITIK
ncbi:MAG: hypothetical protein IKW48_00030 [Akkermansia sp.]|nr:hypothetical protein [Akkermansia sp.]